MLDDADARYRVIEHEPEGRTDIVSGYRGNAIASAAKCIVVMVKVGKKTTRRTQPIVAPPASLI